MLNGSWPNSLSPLSRLPRKQPDPHCRCHLGCRLSVPQGKRSHRSSSPCLCSVGQSLAWKEFSSPPIHRGKPLFPLGKRPKSLVNPCFSRATSWFNRPAHPRSEWVTFPMVDCQQAPPLTGYGLHAISRTSIKTIIVPLKFNLFSS